MMGLIVFAAAAAAASPIPDDELARMRGGFALPGGLSVAIAVQSDTRIDGALVLRSVYRVDQGTPVLQVFAPAPGTSLSNRSTGSSNSVAAPPSMTLTFDRQSGARFDVGGRPGPNVNIVPGSTSGLGNDGSAGPAIAIAAGSGTVQVPTGALKVTEVPNGQQIRLLGNGIDITHLVGSAIGSAITNSANNRTIESSTTLALDISGATSTNLGSSMLRVETLGLDATAAMLPR